MSRFSHIDEYLLGQIEKKRIPGISCGIVEDGVLRYSQGYGFSNLEHGIPATPKSLYGIGSISKQFTAASIMILEGSGDVDINQRISFYIEGLPEEWNDVTVEHLLTHTSGIRKEIWAGGIIEFDRYEHVQREVLATAFGPLDSKPGEKFSYSNTGYRLLGILIEEIGCKSYWDFLEEDTSVQLSAV